MSDRLEADTCLLHVSSGQPRTDEPPGLAVFAAPRKAARGRERDTLFLCLSLRARVPLPAPTYTELLDHATQTYFGCSGSATSALRLALTAVNQRLLARNLRAGSGEYPAQGGLICAVLRGTDFYAVQSGPGLLLVAHPQALERFPTLVTRPLGLSQTPDMQYFHTAVAAEEYFCLCNSAPDHWNDKTLTGLGNLKTLTAVLERLKESTPSDFAALVGRFEMAAATMALPMRMAEAGKKFKPLGALLQRGHAVDSPEALSTPMSVEAVGPLESAEAALPATEELFTPEVEPGPVEALPAPEPEISHPAPADELQAEEPPPPVTASSAPTDWQSLMRRADRLERVEPPPPSIPVVEEIRTEPPPRLRRRAAAGAPAFFEPVRRGARAFGRAFLVTLAEIIRGARQIMARVMPEGMLQKDGLFAIPGWVPVAIAIGIPLLVLSLALVWWQQGGQDKLFNDALKEAMLEKATADLESDPLLVRQHWGAALKYVEQARQIRPADATAAALWQEAQDHVDQMDAVTRLDYQRLLPEQGFGRPVKIKQLLLVKQNLFALDSQNNRIWRLSPTSDNTYALDPTFNCSGGATVGRAELGDLIYMTELGLEVGNPHQAEIAIMAVDKKGNLLYCAPGKDPLSAYLTPPDPGGWINPVAISLYAGRLYVLDPGANEIWQYTGSNGSFTQPAAPYFTGAVYNLSGVMDFVISTTNGELFLIRQDGRMARCSRRQVGEAPICEEEAQFVDSRPGRGAASRLWDLTQPVRMVYNPPPESSLYLLQAETSSIYRLSLQLNLAQHFRPLRPLTGPISAMTMDTLRVFVAAGDNLYLANRP